MKKIQFHDYCRKHKEVKKVRAMLSIAMNNLEDINPDFYHHLTGITYEDESFIKYLIRKKMLELGDLITKDVQYNSAESSCDFNISRYKKYFEWVEVLEKARKIIADYPLNIKTDVYTFSNPNATAYEKKEECLLHYKQNPVFGFNKKYYKVNSAGEKHRLFPLFFTDGDLTDACQIITEYE